MNQAQTSNPSTTGAVAREVAILGGGSAAFAAALRCAELGARVTMIERGTIGGTCVNVGCVPSKILLRAAHIAHLQDHHPFAGIERTAPRLHRRAMIAQQQTRIEQMRQSKYLDLLDGNAQIRLLAGAARFTDQGTLAVDLTQGGTITLVPDRILIATGASPVVPAIPGLADTPFWTSTEALIAEDLPEHLVVVGGGFVAVELAQAFRRLGSRVSLLARSTLLSAYEPTLGEGLAEAFGTEGIDVRLHEVPTAVSYTGHRFILEGSRGALQADRLLIATGRRANTEDLDLEKAGVALDSLGRIRVDRRLRTTAPNVYAAGDCADLPELVYVAAAAATRAAINMMDGDAELDLTSTPIVVFTDPQAAWVGMSEADAAAAGMAVESRILPLEQVPRALANFDTRGFVKLVAEVPSGRLVGAQVLAGAAGEVIQSAALAVRCGMTVTELGDQLFPYLTMAEGLKLAAQAFTRDVQQLSCCAG